MIAKHMHKQGWLSGLNADCYRIRSRLRQRRDVKISIFPKHAADRLRRMQLVRMGLKPFLKGTQSGPIPDSNPNNEKDFAVNKDRDRTAQNNKAKRNEQICCMLWLQMYYYYYCNYGLKIHHGYILVHKT